MEKLCLLHAPGSEHSAAFFLRRTLVGSHSERAEVNLGSRGSTVVGSSSPPTVWQRPDNSAGHRQRMTVTDRDDRWRKS